MRRRSRGLPAKLRATEERGSPFQGHDLLPTVDGWRQSSSQLADIKSTIEPALGVDDTLLLG